MAPRIQATTMKIQGELKMRSPHASDILPIVPTFLSIDDDDQQRAAIASRSTQEPPPPPPIAPFVVTATP